MTVRRCWATRLRNYPDAAAADAALARIWSRCRPGRLLERRAFECPHGPHFHLTKAPFPDRQEHRR